MPVYVATILGSVFAIAATVLSLIFITPENKRKTLNKFFAFLADLFNFKYLILEKIIGGLKDRISEKEQDGTISALQLFRGERGVLQREVKEVCGWQVKRLNETKNEVENRRMEGET